MAPRKSKGSSGPELFDLVQEIPRGLNHAVATLLKNTPEACIAGFDEVGRGPLAGPVVAGCVVFHQGAQVAGLTDSKALSAKKREALEPLIKEFTCWGLGWLWPDDIARLNIHQASLKAMTMAWEDLRTRFPAAQDQVSTGISDGKYCPELPFPCLAQVKGDLLIGQISAASIIAKVARDAWMDEAAVMYPGYGFEQHKGYGTPLHLDAIRRLGPCPIHRLAWISPQLLSSS